VALRGVTFIANHATFGGGLNAQGCGTVEVTRYTHVFDKITQSMVAAGCG
jgi:predicted outer membrane repeat protein